MSATFVSDMLSALEVANTEKQRVDTSRPDRVFCYYCSQPDDFKEDKDDPVYAMTLYDQFSESTVRFKVSNCSTVFFAAVNIPQYNICHSGLLIENDFEVTVNGVTQTSKSGHLLAHAMFVKKEDELSTKLYVSMCTNREAAFNELALVAKNADYYTRAMSPGFVSSMPCSKLVKTLKDEIRKPFDKYWSTRLTEKAEKLGDNVTNCAIFAGRLFYSLAPSQDQKEIAVKGALKVFEELGYSEAKQYISAITK